MGTLPIVSRGTLGHHTNADQNFLLENSSSVGKSRFFHHTMLSLKQDPVIMILDNFYLSWRRALLSITYFNLTIVRSLFSIANASALVE